MIPFAPIPWLWAAGGWIKSGATWAWSVVCEYPRTSLAITACAAAWFAHGWDVDRKLAAQAALFEAEKRQSAADFEAAMNRKRGEVADLILAQLAINDAHRAALKLAMQSADKRERAALAKVPKYVTPLADSRCVVPVGFLQLAAEGVRAANGFQSIGGSDSPETISQETLELVDRPSGVPLSAVSIWQRKFATVAEKWRARALTCDRWVDEQAAEFNKNRKDPSP